MVTCCIMGVVQEDQHVLYRCKLKTECPLRTEFWQSGSFCRRAGGMWWSVKQVKRWPVRVGVVVVVVS